MAGRNVMIQKIKLVLSIILLNICTLNYANNACPEAIKMQFIDKQNNVINILGVVSHSDRQHTYIVTHSKNVEPKRLITMYSGSTHNPQYLLKNNFESPTIGKQENDFIMYKINNKNLNENGQQYIHAYDLAKYNHNSAKLTITTPKYCEKLSTTGGTFSKNVLHLPIKQVLNQSEISTIRDYSLPVFNNDHGEAKLIGFVKKNTIAMTSSEDGTYTAGIQIDLIPELFKNYMDRIKNDKKSIVKQRGMGIPIYACDSAYRHGRSCNSYFQAGKPTYWYEQRNTTSQLKDGDIISAVFFENKHNRLQERDYGTEVNTFKREFNHYLHHMDDGDNTKDCTDAKLYFHVQNSYDIRQDRRVEVSGCWRPYIIY